MKMLRIGLLVGTLGLIFAQVGYAQQENTYTQFMQNKLIVNPAYCGSHFAGEINVLNRNQWIGLEGAPQTQLITFDMPLMDYRVGVGGGVIRDSYGATNRYTFENYYAYRIPLGYGFLGIGLQWSLRYLRVNFDELASSLPFGVDGAVPAGLVSKLVPNFGSGIYYNAENWFVGISVPRLLESNIELLDDGVEISRETRSFYFMGGVIVPLGYDLSLQPQVLCKYLKGAPFEADINLNIFFKEKYSLGLSYRLGSGETSAIGSAISFLTMIEVIDRLLVGISYDYTISNFNNYQNGSLEIGMRYYLKGKNEGENYQNPRFPNQSKLF